MELTSWLALLAVVSVGAISPGPSLAVVMRNTLAGGRGHGVATALGHGVGVGLYALITALGLAVLVTRYGLVFDVIRYGGALFLAWLGIKALLAKKAPPLPSASAAPALARRQGAFEGFMIAFLNPQLAVFFVALFSQFVTADTSAIPSVIMMLTAGGVDAFWYVLVALVLSRGPVLAWLNSKAVWIDKLTGVILLALAIKIIW